MLATTEAHSPGEFLAHVPKGRDISWESEEALLHRLRYPGGWTCHHGPLSHLMISVQLSAQCLLTRRTSGREAREIRRAGSITLTPPGTEATWMADRDTDVVHLFLPPDRRRDEPALSVPVVFAAPMAAHDPLVHQIVLNLMDRVLVDGDNALPLVQAACAHLRAHLRLQYQAKAAEPELRGKMPARHFRRVVDFLEANLHRNVTLEECSDLIGCSRFHFARTFARTAEMPFHRWQVLRRIEKAKTLLSNPDFAISEVSDLVGCSDQSHFCRVFKQATGLTPKQFRHRCESACEARPAAQD